MSVKWLNLCESSSTLTFSLCHFQCISGNVSPVHVFFWFAHVEPCGEHYRKQVISSKESVSAELCLTSSFCTVSTESLVKLWSGLTF